MAWHRAAGKAGDALRLFGRRPLAVTARLKLARKFLKVVGRPHASDLSRLDEETLSRWVASLERLKPTSRANAITNTRLILKALPPHLRRAEGPSGEHPRAIAQKGLVLLQAFKVKCDKAMAYRTGMRIVGS